MIFIRWRLRHSWCRDAHKGAGTLCHMSMSAIPASDDRELMVHAEDAACREIAKELEQQHPRWIVIFGTFTREFFCLPLFAAPPGMKVVAIYPKAAADRMSSVERLYRIREGLSKWNTGERTSEA
jgi:hypothetical protein